jgi:leucyl aminopeptidase (aminopeptidase T)
LEKLTKKDLINLIGSVFPYLPGDQELAIIVDIPRNSSQDNYNWKKRRKLAQEWAAFLNSGKKSLHLDSIKLIAYPDVGSNNADLPEYAYHIKESLPPSADLLDPSGDKVSFKDLFRSTQLIIAPTEYSTTAPLKMAARKYGFRAATMPGFSAAMIPALKIDYNEVNRRVLLVKNKLDKAVSAEVVFLIDSERSYTMFFDLRYRKAHASSGRFPERGTAGNVPSGEAYIVPYEGEKKEISRTNGTLPVQIDNNIVLFTVKKNRAILAEGSSKEAHQENRHLKKDPAYGNMAELGFGVLADFGIHPINEILLDEKLGFHVAFGRSEHFGGIVGPKDFSSPTSVIHLDRIYIPATQPRISIHSIDLTFAQNRTETIIKEGKYTIF